MIPRDEKKFAEARASTIKTKKEKIEKKTKRDGKVTRNNLEGDNNLSEPLLDDNSMSERSI